MRREDGLRWTVLFRPFSLSTGQSTYFRNKAIRKLVGKNSNSTRKHLIERRSRFCERWKWSIPVIGPLGSPLQMNFSFLDGIRLVQSIKFYGHWMLRLGISRDPDPYQINRRNFRFYDKPRAYLISCVIICQNGFVFLLRVSHICVFCRRCCCELAGWSALLEECLWEHEPFGGDRTPRWTTGIEFLN